jgi:hypothetical protein
MTRVGFGCGESLQEAGGRDLTDLNQHERNKCLGFEPWQAQPPPENTGVRRPHCVREARLRERAIELELR